MGGSAPKQKVSPSEIAMADIAKRQDLRSQMLEKEWEDPFRQMMMPQIMQTIGQNPFQTTLSAADRAPIEGQFKQAQASLMDTGQRGGGLRSAMRGLERDRAMAISSAANQARQQGIGRALQFAGGALPNVGSIQGLEGSAMSGLQSSADMFNKRQAANNAAKQQSSAGMGSLIGSGMGMAGMGLAAAGMF